MIGPHSQPLARLGATVVGLDPSLSNVAMASAHTSHDPEIASRVTYCSGRLEDHEVGVAGAGQFDAVVASEVVEHLSNLKTFVAEVAPLVKVLSFVFFISKRAQRSSSTFSSARRRGSVHHHQPNPPLLPPGHRGSRVTALRRASGVSPLGRLHLSR